MKKNQIRFTTIAIAITTIYASSAMADTALGANAYVTPGNGNTAVGGTAGGQVISTGSSGSTAVGAIATWAGTTYADGTPILLGLTPGYAYGSQTAIGTGSFAWGTGDLAVGGAAAISQPALGTISPATALGYRATVWGNNSIAIGTNAVAGPAVAGSAPPTPITVTGAISIGANARASADSSTALGMASQATAVNSTAIGAGANAMGVNSVALGAGSFAGQDNVVEVGGRRVTGLAAGTAATDAVNLGQLQAAIAGIPGADPTSIINRAVGQANAYTDQSIANLRREYSRAIASVAASPALPSLAAGERAFAVGSGFYNGQQSLGVAYGQALSNRAMVNVSFSTAGGMPVSRIGAAWKF